MLKLRQIDGVTQMVAIGDGVSETEANVLATLHRRNERERFVRVYVGKSEDDFLCIVSADDTEQRMIEIISLRLAAHCRSVLGHLILDPIPASGACGCP